MKRKLALVAVAVLPLVVTGCGLDDDPCTYPVFAGKVLMFFPEDDGTEVEVDGRRMVCEDGEAVAP